MRCLRISLLVCTCLFPALSTPATDNSFKLDFNGDGRTDIALYREGSRGSDAPQPSIWYFLDTNTGVTSSMHWGRSLDVPAPADYNGDGKTDPGIFRWWNFEYGDANEWWLNKGPAGHLVLNGLELGYYKFSRNYLGDARAEVGQVYPVDISQTPGQTCFVSVFLVADQDGFILRKTVGDACNVNPTPVPADYDGDGHSEIAVYVNRHFKVWFPPYAPGYTVPGFLHYLDVDIPAVGDYDGDGRADFAGVKAQGGQMLWRFRKTTTGEEVEIGFGLATDKPVPGDYDGDGKTDLAVFRPSDGSWWIKNSSSGVVQTIHYGLATDSPLASPVIPFSPV
jgi:spore coat protein A, manganese oxidase